jgi:glutamate N-acetyltransferase/amino-acid N-acetyltransferase
MKDNIFQVKGFLAATAKAQVKKGADREDLGLVVSSAPAAVAGVFTQNQVKAASILVNQERIVSGQGRAILVNSGNANACTGKQGLKDTRFLTRMISESLGLPENQIFMASTGVIGQPLPIKRMARSLPFLVEGLNENNLPAVAQAIMTTDTFPKIASREVPLGKTHCRLVGIAKGAGMIQPHLATMLGFVLTDASVAPTLLNELLREGADRSFNSITVDGDTSTNDCILLLAGGTAGNPAVVELQSSSGEIFTSLLQTVMADLAAQVVRDGEGAAHVFKVIIEGAATPAEAVKAARTVALSPLVKTAVAGTDANWGRIMAALGRAGIRLDPNRVDIYFGPHQVVRQGLGVGPEAETAAAALMATGSFDLRIHLNLGAYTDYYLTCDLTSEYVHINADYRT